MSRWAHPLRVRYSEVDNQGVVFNSRYWEYLDHATTMWLRSRGLVYEQLRHDRWDFVLRWAEGEWLAPAAADETLSLAVELLRVGTSSFEIAFDVLRDGEVPLFRARAVYVGVDPTSKEKQALPEFVRQALEVGGPAADYRGAEQR